MMIDNDDDDDNDIQYYNTFSYISFHSFLLGLCPKSNFWSEFIIQKQTF